MLIYLMNLFSVGTYYWDVANSVDRNWKR